MPRAWLFAPRTCCVLVRISNKRSCCLTSIVPAAGVPWLIISISSSFVAGSSQVPVCGLSFLFPNSISQTRTCFSFMGQPETSFLKRPLGIAGTLWGVSGAITLLSFALWRMTVPMLEAFSGEYELGIWHYIVGGLWVLFMGYSEGYKGFQKGYSPRVAARALYLRDRCTWLRLVLAPLFCLGFFHSTKRRRITVFVLLTVITLIVILFKYIPQPWRGVLDLGVVVGLSWGIIATIVSLIKFWMAEEVPFDPEVVEPTSTNLEVSS